MKPIIAIDGGGTKTVIAVFETCGKLLFIKQTEGSNLQARGDAHVQNLFQALFNEIKHTLNLKDNDFSYAFLGLSGADLGEDFTRLTKICEAVFPLVPFQIVNDAWIVMRSGVKTSFGAVAICGTGTNSAAINRSGEKAILRALGYSTGTYGGGLDIAREAFHCIYRAEERSGEPTLLTEKILCHLGMMDLESMIPHLYPVMTLDKYTLGSITALVFEAAQEGDRVAQAILQKIGTSIGAQTTGVILQVGIENETVPIVIGGRVFTNESPYLIEAMAAEIDKKCKNAYLIKPRFQPVVGAFLSALDYLGIQQDEALEKHLEESEVSL